MIVFTTYVKMLRVLSSSVTDCPRVRGHAEHFDSPESYVVVQLHSRVNGAGCTDSDATESSGFCSTCGESRIPVTILHAHTHAPF